MQAPLGLPLSLGTRMVFTPWWWGGYLSRLLKKRWHLSNHTVSPSVGEAHIPAPTKLRQCLSKNDVPTSVMKLREAQIWWEERECPQGFHHLWQDRGSHFQPPGVSHTGWGLQCRGRSWMEGGRCANPLENRILFFISLHILLGASKSCTNFILYFSTAVALKHLNFLQTLMNATWKHPWGQPGLLTGGDNKWAPSNLALVVSNTTSIPLSFSPKSLLHAWQKRAGAGSPLPLASQPASQNQAKQHQPRLASWKRNLYISPNPSM